MPERFGNRYSIKRELGRGNMGRVYHAWDEKLHRDVALKVIDLGMEDSPELRARERFEREAATAGQLHSSNIVAVHDIAEEGELEFIVMEYLEGDDLKRIINEQRPLSLVRKLDIIAQTCDGLHCAHKAKIVHRDVKPANIMVLKESGVVKLVDFGIARIGPNPAKSIALMTPAYSSPEQLEDEDRLDGRSDIFSAGIVLYELVTYQHPFLDRVQSNKKGDVEERIKSYRPKPLSELMRDCPPKLEEIVRRALAKSPHDRYQTAELMAFDLRGLADSLKRSAIEDLTQQGRRYLEKGNFGLAEESFKRVLEIDGNYHPARLQLEQIQAQVGTRRRSQTIDESLRRGTEALDACRYEEALAEFDKALRIDPKREEARKGRDQALRGQRVARCMERATKFAASGEFKSAKSELQDALSIEPAYAPAQKLMEDVVAGLIDQERQRQVRRHMESARRSMAEKNFSRALESLARAEEVDPTNPEVEALMRSARSGQEQEERQHLLLQLRAEIQSALNHEQFLEAEVLAERARQDFPDDAQVRKLHTHASRQMELQRRRRYVDEELQRGRDLLQKNQFDQAMAALKRALEVAPEDARLTSLLKTVQELQTRSVAENLVRQTLRDANDFISHRDFSNAIEMLQRSLAEVGRSPELTALLEVAYEQQEEHREQQEKRVRQVANEARGLIEEDKYPEALELLECAQKEQQSGEIETLLDIVRKRREEFERGQEQTLTRAGRLLESGDPERALAVLDSAPRAYSRSREFQKLFSDCRRYVDRAAAVRSAVVQAGQYIQHEKLDEAEAVIAVALQSFPGDASLSHVLQHVSENRARLRQAKQYQLIEAARAAMNRMEFREVVSLLTSTKWELEDVSGAAEEAKTLLERARTLEQGLTQCCTDIQEAIKNAKFDEALAGAEKARKNFPGDPQLLRLQAQATRLAEAQHKSKYVERQIEEGQTLVQHGQFDQAVALLTRALENEPDHPRLSSYLRTIEELKARAARESLVESAQQQANDQIRNKNFARAVKLIETALADVDSSQELKDLLKLAREQEAEHEHRQVRIAHVISRAETLLLEDNYHGCIEELERERESLDALEIDDLLLQARKRWDEFEQARELTIERAQAMLQDDHAEEALKLLDAAPKSYSRDEEFSEVYRECRARVERTRENLRDDLFRETQPVRQGHRRQETASPVSPHEPAELPEIDESELGERPRRAGALWAAAGFSVLLIAILVFVVAGRVSKFKGKQAPTATPQNGYVELNPIPWAEVLSVKKTGGEELRVSNVPGQTPLRLSLPPGDYVVDLKGQNGLKQVSLTVESGKPVQWHDLLPGFNADTAVNELLK